VWGGLSPALPGSALGFSQPLSGLRRREFHGLVSCRSQSLGCLPSELSPRKEPPPLSRPPCSLAVIHQRASVRHPRPSPPVSPTPTPFGAVARLPRRLWAPFPRAEARFPVTLGSGGSRPPCRQLHPLRSLAPLASPFASTRAEARASGRCSPGLPAPPETCSRASDPPTHPSARPEHAPRPVDLDARTGGPWPSDPGERAPRQRTTAGRPRGQTPVPFETGPRRLSTACPSPLALDEGRPSSRPTELLSTREVSDSRRSRPASHGVPCLLVDLVDPAPRRLWLMGSPRSRAPVSGRPRLLLEPCAAPPSLAG
jgi:hypothetical protein